MTNTTTTTGVATLKQLQKECLKIDLTKVEYKVGYNEGGYTPQKFHTDTKNLNPNIRIGKSSNQLLDLSVYYKNPLLDLEIPSLKIHSYALYKFGGGKRGRSGYTHNDFTDASILVEKSTDQIVGVLYALDNDYLNEWLRQTIDPTIPNNYDELHAEKEFEVLITTTTFSTEKVKVVGRSYDECLETMKQNDPMLDVGGMRNLFSGMKTTSDGKGAKPIPSSYDEWVSLNAKEVA